MHFVYYRARLLRDCSASGMFAVNNVMNCPALVRKLVFVFLQDSGKPLRIVLFRLSVALTSGGNTKFDRTGRNSFMSTTLARTKPPMSWCNIWVYNIIYSNFTG